MNYSANKNLETYVAPRLEVLDVPNLHLLSAPSKNNGGGSGDNSDSDLDDGDLYGEISQFEEV